VLEERLDSATTPDRQYVWDIQYLDDLILRDRDSDSNGSLDERLYALHDANYNVTAVTDAAGAVKERYRYDAYGNRHVMSAGFGGLGQSAYGWELGQQGLPVDPETGLIDNRARYRHPLLGRFCQRDPSGYGDSFNL
jgi:RHS repeat-associated protein